VDTDKVVITILPGSVVTQTVLDGLNVHSPGTNFIQFTCAMKTMCSLLARTVYFMAD